MLHRQSARLRKLTEDLVEASKASSGCLPVHLARTDVNVLLSQLAGDYLEKLEAAQLEPVFHPAPSQPKIQADGQLLSRVLGNLFSNICKYAMTHSFDDCFASQWKDVVEYETYPELAEYIWGNRVGQTVVLASMTPTCGGTTEAIQISVTTSRATKIFRNGQIFILVGEQMYNSLGQRVK